MAADLGEFIGDETDVHPRSKRRSLAAMAAHDVTASPMTSSPMTAPMRGTPPHSSLALERPMLEQLMTPSPASIGGPSVSASSRQFAAASDHDILKFAQSPLTRAANHDLQGRPSIANSSLDDLTQRLSAYSLNRELPSSAPVTPPTGQNFYDPRSRASTLTESSPSLQPIQKDMRIPQHYLTPPAEGQSSPAALALSQSLPVSRRNSSTDNIRVVQDLSVIYENPPVNSMYSSDHRKSSGTLSGTWSNASGDPTYVGSSKGYDDVVEQRTDSVPSKNVFGMLKTEDGQFPFLSNLPDTNPSSQQVPLPRGVRHSSTPSWPGGPPIATRNHATRSSYPDGFESRGLPPEVEYRAVSERTSANPSPHPSMQRTPPKGHSPGRFDMNAPDTHPYAWSGNEDHGVDFHPRSHSAYYGTATSANAYIHAGGYMPAADNSIHSPPYYGTGSRGHHPYDQGYPPRPLDSAHDNTYDYRSHHYYNRELHQPRNGGGGRHKRPGSNDYERLILSKSRIQDFATKIPDLCRDQNGCRHLQAELDTREEEAIEVIYKGAKPYFADLMSDPFGNYLCQKLLETCNDTQRTELVKLIAPTIVSISLNQHGTRAVQKLLDHLTLPEQIELVKEALRPDVVPLTKDLNGNHVIQKCLNRLESNDKQFIYDAVAANCIEVATHKHGCCVFQRCIDHASDDQADQLYKVLIKNTIPLSQDQFGNYVLQYILDKPDTNLSPLIHQFQNHVVKLSRAKFSSNVIEKCVRVASPNDREFLIKEMIRPGAMADMIDDNYANYVVQTALDYADGDQKAALIKEIMPLLSSVKSRSWYKRIMNKLGLGMHNNNAHYDGGSRHGMPSRHYMDDGLHHHPRMPSIDRGGHGSMQGYGHLHPSRRSPEHHPPSFMHTPSPMGSDRNGYRPQPQSHGQSQVPQQYRNFYPYGPQPSIHRSDYGSSSEY